MARPIVSAAPLILPLAFFGVVITSTPSHAFVSPNLLSSAYQISRPKDLWEAHPVAITPNRQNDGTGTAFTCNGSGVDVPPQPYASLSSIADGARNMAKSVVSSIFHLDVTGAELRSSFLVHQGSTTAILLRAPSIGSFSLAQNFTDKSLKRFSNAVNTVVKENPILTGKAISLFCGLGSEVRVVPGAFNSFVQVIDGRENLPSPESAGAPQYLNYIDQHIQPLISEPCAPTIKQMKNKETLFQTTVILLPDDYSCIFIRMSHILGDILTYTSLMDQLSSSHDVYKPRPRPIQWENLRQSAHQISAENLSDKDIHIMYGPPFFLGVCANLIGKPDRSHEFLSLSREKINAKRKELLASDIGDNVALSSNDIITAALCEADRSSDIFAVTKTVRYGHSKEYEKAGNLYVEIPFPRTIASDPNAFHKLVKRGYYYERDQLPLMPFLRGRVGRITSCVAPVSFSPDFGESKTICQQPPRDFVYMCPFDSAVIFSMDKEHIGIMHNFLEIDKNGLLGEIMA